MMKMISCEVTFIQFDDQRYQLQVDCVRIKKHATIKKKMPQITQKTYFYDLRILHTGRNSTEVDEALIKEIEIIIRESVF